ncbi:hypothetical protein FIBSPDRAFT_858994 [Athelia psychrophila]|uniref:Uncharacterized protein n=1 Tax=Athelia psychrophila TaxID=1759441 RepID=A0A166LKL2_9AGAM|nr:hypothetical protein FIBSPDRAFT_858994 [Fibularhizoctonia sp. CBS 109695]
MLYEFEGWGNLKGSNVRANRYPQLRTALRKGYGSNDELPILRSHIYPPRSI